MHNHWLYDDNINIVTLLQCCYNIFQYYCWHFTAKDCAGHLDITMWCPTFYEVTVWEIINKLRTQLNSFILLYPVLYCTSICNFFEKYHPQWIYWGNTWAQSHFSWLVILPKDRALNNEGNIDSISAFEGGPYWKQRLLLNKWHGYDSELGHEELKMQNMTNEGRSFLRPARWFVLLQCGTIKVNSGHESYDGHRWQFVLYWKSWAHCTS